MCSWLKRNKRKALEGASPRQTMNQRSVLTPPVLEPLFGGELRIRLIRSFFGSYAFIGIARLISFLTRVLVARVMVDSAPQAFGIYAEGLMIFGILTVVQYLGIPAHMIRQDRPLYGAFLATTLGTGGFLALLLFWSADFFSGFSLHLPHALRIFALVLPVNALSNVPTQYLNRELKLERLVIVEVLGNFIFFAVAGFLAFSRQNLYCLVWAYAISAAAKALVLWLIVGKEIRLTLDHGDIGRLIRGSSRLLILSLLEILFHQVDIGITGAFLTEAEVGLWNMAMVLVLLPSTLIETAFYQVLYPLFSRYKEEPQKIIRAYRTSTFAIAGIEVPLYATLFVSFPQLTVWILGPRWAAAGDLAQLLCIYCILDPFSVFGQTLIKAQGKDWTLVRFLSLSVAMMVLFGLVLVPRYQLMGIVLARYAVFFGDLYLILALVREIGSRNLFTRELGLLYLSFPLIVALGSLAESPGWKLGITSATGLLVMMMAAWKIAPTAREFLQPLFQKFFRPAGDAE